MSSGKLDARPLSALLSQVLVAFTVEADNRFERRMADAGHPGAPLSLVVWFNLMRFLAGGARPVRELAALALAPETRIHGEVGCLERWRFVKLEPDPADDCPIPMREHPRAGKVLRDGWGSGRGIRSGWPVRPTRRGQAACEAWAQLPGEIERRWEARFGAGEIASLREGLERILEAIGLELPQGLAAYREPGESYPPREAGRRESLPLAALLAQVLLAFTLEFERESRAPLTLCANILRVLGEQPAPESDIPRLTGGSAETAGIGWQTKAYVAVEPDPARRGRLVRLTPAGLRVQQQYRDLTAEIEQRWESRFGKETIRQVRDSLAGLFEARAGGRLLLAEGLVPDEGTVRAGQQTPALGRKDIGTAARQRMRDLVAQTELFRRDPAHALPHYPLWDMNRGFGP